MSRRKKSVKRTPTRTRPPVVTTLPATPPPAPPEPPETVAPPQALFPIVGIGFSAGGLEALEDVFRHLPVDMGAAFIVVSHQHLIEDMTSNQVRERVEPYVRQALPEGWINGKTVWHINPTGKFYIGGPDGDAGLTGRKIIVDTYGGAAPHGGGAFSGKDPTKVDRSAAYAARYVAKNIVAAGFADRCTLQLAYAIGVARPLSIYIDTHGTGKVPEDKLEEAVREAMDLTPRGIRKHLDLNKPIYARTSAYGHFGREPDKEGGFSWEKTDLADKLKSAMA